MTFLKPSLALSLSLSNVVFSDRRSRAFAHRLFRRGGRRRQQPPGSLISSILNQSSLFLIFSSDPSLSVPVILWSSKTRRKIQRRSLHWRKRRVLRATAIQGLRWHVVRDRFRYQGSLYYSILIFVWKSFHVEKLTLISFADVHRWVSESFTASKSARGQHVSEILCPFPITTDSICKQIPTAFIHTSNYSMC